MVDFRSGSEPVTVGELTFVPEGVSGTAHDVVSVGAGSRDGRRTLGVQRQIENHDGLQAAGDITFELTSVETSRTRGTGERTDPIDDPKLRIKVPDAAPGVGGHVVMVDDGGFYSFVRSTDGEFVVPVSGAAGPNRGLTSGLGRVAVRVLGVLGAKRAVSEASELVVRAIEDKLREPRLRTFTAGNYRNPPTDDNRPSSANGGSTLLLIHGFNSSSHNCFRFDSPFLTDLEKRYPGGVLAYDHPTISYSPEVNAADLANRLTNLNSDSIHILAHSRGGLVARDLLRQAGAEANIRSITFVGSPNGGTPLADFDHLGDFLGMTINALALLPDNPVTDPVAVALEVLRDWVLDAVFSAFEGIDVMNPANSWLEDLNNAETGDTRLRAISADFHPRSNETALLRARNRLMDVVFDGVGNDLVVPTRSTYLTSGRFNIPATDRMVFDSSFGISHSTFWQDRTVLERLTKWLDPDDDSTPSPVPVDYTDPAAEFEDALRSDDAARVRKLVASVDTDLVDAAAKHLGCTFVSMLSELGLRDRTRFIDGPLGTVVVLPGILGSRLDVDGREVWLNAWQLMRGRFRWLDLTAGGPGDGRQVTVSGLMSVYAGLVDALSVNWNVLPFAYDWRQSIPESAQQLESFLDEHCVDLGGKEPVHFVSHSMGGLVARTFLADHVSKSPRADIHPWNGRLVQLGSPNWGSFAIVAAALGDEFLVKAIAAADLYNSKDQLLAAVRSFPSVFQLFPAPHIELPDGAVEHEKLFDEELWRGIDPHVLAEATRYHESVRQRRPLHELFGPGHFVFVAGDNQATPYRCRVGADNRVSFGITTLGDSRVPHDFGYGNMEDEPDEIFFVETNHGDLASDTRVLSALDAILLGEKVDLNTTATRGMSQRRTPQTAVAEWIPSGQLDRALGLPAVADGGRGGGDVSDVTVSANLRLGVAHYIGGGRAGQRELIGLRVRIVHASLEQANWPVIAGRYKGIPMFGALSFLDLRLQGALRRLQEARLLPEDAGTARYLPYEDSFPPGVIIVGQGEFGELTAARLSRSVELGVLDYGHHHHSPTSTEREVLGVAAVLAGSPGRYGLSVSSSLAAIVSGVSRAAAALRGSVTINELEILEFHEQKAEEAAAALARLVETQATGSYPHGVVIEGEARVETRPGGRPGNGGVYEDTGAAWPRIVLEVDEPKQATGNMLLRWKSLGRRAQAENLEVEFDPSVIRSHVNVAVHSHRADDLTNITLFELLFPNSKKLEIDETDNLHLLVGEDTAWIPWEMVTGRSATGELQEPLALRSGLLRQLVPNESHEPSQILSPTEKSALVIGDPPGNPNLYARLPGARDEARAVFELLSDERAGYTVTDCVFDDGDAPSDDIAARIRNQFFGRHYRIIHIAAHGHFETASEHAAASASETGRSSSAKNGVVIGPNHVLSATDFRQRLVAPDLVFLNCCHLGRIDGMASSQTDDEKGSDSPGRVPYSELAASVAYQLMKSGVKAVVAAGWAVNDAAAKAFAETFYELMLSGATFGEAVKNARQAAADFSRSNTWGAYQCWGDPDFQFIDTGSPTQPGPPTVMSSHHLCRLLDIEVTRAGNVVSTSGVRSIAENLEQLSAVADREGYGKDLAVCEGFGNAYAEIGDFDRAVDWYQKVVSDKDAKATASIAAIEQLVNMEARLAVLKHRESKDGRTWQVKEGPQKLFERAQPRLTHLDNIKRTVERCTLRGSLNKKWASTIDRTTHPDIWLEKVHASHAAYMHGWNLATEDDITGSRLEVYAGCMALLLSAVLADSPEFTAKDREKADEVLAKLKETRAERRATLRRGGDYWARAEIVDIDAAQIVSQRWLTELVAREASGDLKKVTRTKGGHSDGAAAQPASELIVNGFKEAFAVRSTTRQRLSPSDNYTDLAVLLPTKEERDVAREIAAALAD